jgi:hypothetical protein
MKTPLELLLENQPPGVQRLLRPSPVVFKHGAAGTENPHQMRRYSERQHSLPDYMAALNPNVTEHDYFRWYTLPDGRRALLIVQGGVERWWIEPRRGEQLVPVEDERQFAVYSGLWLAEEVSSGGKGVVYPSNSLLAEFTSGILSGAQPYPQGLIQTGQDACSGGTWPEFPDAVPIGAYSPERVKQTDAALFAIDPNRNPHYADGLLRWFQQARGLFVPPPTGVTIEKTGLCRVIDGGAGTVRYWAVNCGASGVTAHELTVDTDRAPLVHCYLAAMAAGSAGDVGSRQWRAIEAVVFLALEIADDAPTITLSATDLSGGAFDSHGAWTWNSDGSAAAAVHHREDTAPNGEPYNQSRVVEVTAIDPVAGTCSVSIGPWQSQVRSNGDPAWSVTRGQFSADLFGNWGQGLVEPDISQDGYLPLVARYLDNDTLEVMSHKGDDWWQNFTSATGYEPIVACGSGATNSSGLLRSCGGETATASRINSGSTGRKMTGWESTAGISHVRNRVFGTGGIVTRELSTSNPRELASKWAMGPNADGACGASETLYPSGPPAGCCETATYADERSALTGGNVTQVRGARIITTVVDRTLTISNKTLTTGTQSSAGFLRSPMDKRVWLIAEFDRKIWTADAQREGTRDAPEYADCELSAGAQEFLVGGANVKWIWGSYGPGNDGFEFKNYHAGTVYDTGVTTSNIDMGPQTQAGAGSSLESEAVAYWPDGSQTELSWSDGEIENMASTDLINTTLTEFSIGVSTAGGERIYNDAPGEALMASGWTVAAPVSLGPAFRACGVQ